MCIWPLLYIIFNIILYMEHILFNKRWIVQTISHYLGNCTSDEKPGKLNKPTKKFCNIGTVLLLVVLHIASNSISFIYTTCACMHSYHMCSVMQKHVPFKNVQKFIFSDWKNCNIQSIYQRKENTFQRVNSSSLAGVFINIPFLRVPKCIIFLI